MKNGGNIKKLITLLTLSLSFLANAAELTCSNGWFDLQATIVNDEGLENVIVTNKYRIVASTDYVEDSNHNQDNKPPYWFVLPTNKETSFGRRTLVLEDTLSEISLGEEISVNLLCSSSAAELTCEKNSDNTKFASHRTSSQVCWECTEDGEVCWAVPCE